MDTKPKLYLAIVCVICLTAGILVVYLLCYSYSEYLWLEAEDADTLTPDFEIAKDPLASGGEYLWIPEGTGGDPGKGVAVYAIHINTSGDYVIWGRAMAPSGDDNSFFVQMDEGFEAIRAISLSDNWHWDAVNHLGSGEESYPTSDPLIFSLSAGEHTLRIKQCEDGVKLDKLLITNDKSYVPANIVGSISGTVITANETGIAYATVTLATLPGDEIPSITADSNGNFAFTGIPPGYYNLTASNTGFWTDSDPVTIKADEITIADVMLCKKCDLNAGGGSTGRCCG